MKHLLNLQWTLMLAFFYYFFNSLNLYFQLMLMPLGFLQFQNGAAILRRTAGGVNRKEIWKPFSSLWSCFTSSRVGGAGGSCASPHLWENGSGFHPHRQCGLQQTLLTSGLLWTSTLQCHRKEEINEGEQCPETCEHCAYWAMWMSTAHIRKQGLCLSCPLLFCFLTKTDSALLLVVYWGWVRSEKNKKGMNKINDSWWRIPYIWNSTLLF